jgi:hypothetical protein
MHLSPSVDVDDDDDDDDDEEAIASENSLLRLRRLGSSQLCISLPSILSASENLTRFTDLRQSSITFLPFELPCFSLTILTDVRFIFSMLCLGRCFSMSRGFRTLSALLLSIHLSVSAFFFVLWIFSCFLFLDIFSISFLRCCEASGFCDGCVANPSGIFGFSSASYIHNGALLLETIRYI